MRRLCACAAALLVLLGLSLFHMHCLSLLTGQLTGLLQEAQTCVLYEDWDAALDKTEAAMEIWVSKGAYLHLVLQHRDTDEVLLGFHEVRQFLYTQEVGGEYAAANARLITQIDLLREMEEPSLKNIL